MKMLVKDFAELCGVSVRTLHYYDEIGLLKPSLVDNRTGYRYYGKESLDRMQEIMFYRELDFSLKSIKRIISSPDYDKNEAQSLVKKLHDYITENFYDCKKEILAGLGQMYVFDERFRNNIDRHGEGTAQFISDAIGVYCR